MKVLVNATPLLAPLTGIGQYIRHLFGAIEAHGGVELHMRYGLRIKKGFPEPRPETVGEGGPARLNDFAQRFLPRYRTLRRIAERVSFGYQSSKLDASMLYHEPNYVALPHKGPMVLTVCDMSCFDLPETHPKERVELMQRDMPASIQRADHILVISEATRAALQRCFNVDSQCITTTYLAADSRFKPQSAQQIQAQMALLGLTAGGYVLCVGTLEPRKNLGTLFSAYTGLPASLRRRFPLVLAGIEGWKTHDLLRKVETLRDCATVHQLGYVPEVLMPALYAGAAAFCYPSRYEGFGLPALEAMACGVPVLTCNQTSLPEVVGDAGLMVDPDDVDSMRERLRSLLEDRVFAAELGMRGHIRAATFSWERCARQTISVYEQVLTNHQM
jgi:alpha-1,3-rhamnosyl/mannosyltransferase